jgi:Uma2 family endonuclease
MTLAPRSFVTAEEYLEREHLASEKSEYYAGEIFAMAGASLAHVRICANLMRFLGNRLAAGPCLPYGSDLRIATAADGLYTYPDVSVICGRPDLIPGKTDTALNPTVLIEVLSESTEAYNRGAKFGLYQMIPSFREYLLVSQISPEVELRSRRDDGAWSLEIIRGLDSLVRFASLQIDLPLAEIYQDVEFPDPATIPNPDLSKRRTA